MGWIKPICGIGRILVLKELRLGRIVLEIHHFIHGGSEL